MSVKPEPSAVTAFRLTAGEAERRMHRMAMRTENVIFGEHALIRMEERGITDAQVYEILRKGRVVEPPDQTKFGEWKCKIVKQIRGGREVGAICIFLKNGKTFTKTVEWEDVKK